jgi:hypothetical protein
MTTDNDRRGFGAAVGSFTAGFEVYIDQDALTIHWLCVLPEIRLVAQPSREGRIR